MTSIVNLFSNFNDLTKPKSVTDNVTDYKANANSCNGPSPSLSQGKKFKKYQGKIANNLEKKIKKSDLVEGFEGIKVLDLNKNGLTEQTNNLLNKNDFTSQQQTLSNLKNDYQNTLNEYQTLTNKISCNTTNYIDRVSPNNPYLGKVIQLQGGYLFYVTNQGVAKYISQFPLDVYTQVSGKNGFPPTGQFTTLSIPWDNSYSTPGSTIPTKPALITGTPIEVGESVGNEGVNVFVNSVVKNPQSSYVGCYNNIPASTEIMFVPKMTSNSAMTNVGSMNYAQCQSYAVNSANQYFGLQGVDGNGNGNCMVSNDLAGSQINGQAVNYNTTALWASNTTVNNPGSTASLTISGTLSVLNSSGAAIFATPNTSTPPSNYIGCYAEQSTRAMQLYNNGSQQYNNLQCQQIAQSQGMTYYGLQNSNSGQNAQCTLSSNLGDAQQYGVANNCTQITDGSWSGGGWSNAVYSTSTPNNNYFLILQDDGNMCLYRGSPTDNQGAIWNSMTNGKQQQPNPNFAAAKGKFGQNWIPTGSTLAPGDFVGSTNGSIYLIMQSDGNLVLYTSTSSSKCSTVGGNTVGAQDANALYQIVAMGNKNSIGKLAFIDQNSQSHSYPNTNIQYSKNYTSYTGIDSAGYDIPGAAYGNATVEQCQSTCDSNPECAGFAFSDNICYPKTSSMFPNGAQQVNSRVNLYTRNKGPIVPPIGVPGTVVNVDTIMYDNYKDGGDIGSEYGLANATTTQKQQMSQLQSKLNMLTSQINGYTNKFSSGTDSLNSQSSKNMEGLGDYLKDFKKINTNIKNFNTNIENILNDSDITVLQKNYDYLFWSILAAGTVLVTMNIVKKQ